MARHGAARRGVVWYVVAKHGVAFHVRLTYPKPPYHNQLSQSTFYLENSCPLPNHPRSITHICTHMCMRVYACHMHDARICSALAKVICNGIYVFTVVW